MHLLINTSKMAITGQSAGAILFGCSVVRHHIPTSALPSIIAKGGPRADGTHRRRKGVGVFLLEKLAAR
jgi:hypothetical protein